MRASFAFLAAAVSMTAAASPAAGLASGDTRTFTPAWTIDFVDGASIPTQFALAAAGPVVLEADIPTYAWSDVPGASSVTFSFVVDGIEFTGGTFSAEGRTLHAGPLVNQENFGLHFGGYTEEAVGDEVIQKSYYVDFYLAGTDRSAPYRLTGSGEALYWNGATNEFFQVLFDLEGTATFA